MRTNSKLLRKVSITITLLLVTITALGLWYKYTYSMETALHKEINDPKLATKLLIATQGSKFKDEVVSGIIAKLEHRPIYINIIDVSELANIKPSDWAAIVIIHTSEMGKSPNSVSDFVKRTNDSDLIILTTSGDGNYHIDGVNGITSASKLTDVDRCVREIMDRIEIKIAPEEISTFR